VVRHTTEPRDSLAKAPFALQQIYRSPSRRWQALRLGCRDQVPWRSLRFDDPEVRRSAQDWASCEVQCLRQEIWPASPSRQVAVKPHRRGMTPGGNADCCGPAVLASSAPFSRVRRLRPPRRGRRYREYTLHRRFSLQPAHRCKGEQSRGWPNGGEAASASPHAAAVRSKPLQRTATSSTSSGALNLVGTERSSRLPVHRADLSVRFPPSSERPMAANPLCVNPRGAARSRAASGHSNVVFNAHSRPPIRTEQTHHLCVRHALARDRFRTFPLRRKTERNRAHTADPSLSKARGRVIRIVSSTTRVSSIGAKS